MHGAAAELTRALRIATRIDDAEASRSNRTNIDWQEQPSNDIACG